MLTQTLILWLLSEAPAHGYSLKRILSEPWLRFWFPVETGSIYSALASLAKAGHVEPYKVERDGARPERTLFRIRPEGRKQLQELLRSAWIELPSASELIYAALAAQSELDERELATLCSERARLLRKRLDELDRLANSAPNAEMVARQRALTTADLEWTERFIASCRHRTANDEE